MAELLLDIMASVGVSSVSFCLNDIIPLLVCSQVKVEKSQVRKVVQECWKLTPASNSLSYTPTNATTPVSVAIHPSGGLDATIR